MTLLREIQEKVRINSGESENFKEDSTTPTQLTNTKIADKISLSDDLDLYLKLISYQGFGVCCMYLGLRPEQDQLTKS